MVEEIDPHIMLHLYDGTWMHYDYNILLEENTLNENLQDGGGVVDFSTAKEKAFSNYPRNFLNYY